MNILITGFAGSLGGEFTRQLLERGDTVTGIDNNEWAVASYPCHERLTKRLGDFYGMVGTFDLIIHCAAYKHIELIEENQDAGWFNNVTATEVFYRNVDGTVLFISTDKSVEPSSHYGESKKRAEEITRERGGVIARLGNIMGSSGSVIPKWEEAISKGNPLLVTDLRMSRYMIPVDEAVKKILSLLPKALPGCTIIPEMGDPIILTDIVSRVLEKHGLPSDYPTKTIGMRPGEKLHEKLKWDTEKVIYSDINGIIVHHEKDLL